MQTSLKKQILIALSLFLVIITLAIVLLPKTLSIWISSSLQQECPRCELHIRELKLKLFPVRLIAKGIQFKGDPEASTVLNASADHLKFHFRFLDFFRGAPTLELVDLERAQVIVKEKSIKSLNSGRPFPELGTPFQMLPPLRVNKVAVHQSQFAYEHLHRGKIAKIEVKNIVAHTNSFATRDWLMKDEYEHPFSFKSTALLENSGRVKLDFTFEPFTAKNKDHILIEVQDQDMSKLNGFFEIDEGLRLKGTLRIGLADLQLREGYLTGILIAAYQDLEFDYQKTSTRNGIETFLQNVLQSALISKTRPKGKDETMPKANVAAQRKPYEPITKLLIRGIKDAALKILKGSS